MKYWICGAALCAALALGVAVWTGSPGPAPETAKPEIVQKDGSKVLEVAPNPKAKPKHVVPKGAKVERTGAITVTPTKPCPTVTTEWSLVRMPDQTRRMVVSSPDGEVTGIDIPVEALKPPKRWAAGLSYGTNNTYGVTVERDIDTPITPVRLGLDINQTRHNAAGAAGVETRVRVMVQF